MLGPVRCYQTYESIHTADRLLMTEKIVLVEMVDLPISYETFAPISLHATLSSDLRLGQGASVSRWHISDFATAKSVTRLRPNVKAGSRAENGE